jgi:transposase-like protein
MNKYQVMRPLTQIEREKLVESIKQYGIKNPIIMDENGDIIDGHHRDEIAKELGIECEYKITTDLDENQKIELAYQMNLAVRNLTKEEREQAWADMRKRGMSYRQIAEVDGTVSKSTVASTVQNWTVENTVKNQEVTGTEGEAQGEASKDTVIRKLSTVSLETVENPVENQTVKPLGCTPRAR